MYYTDLEDLTDLVSDVLENMGMDDLNFEVPTYDEVMKRGMGYLFVTVYIPYRAVKADADELAFDLERGINRYVYEKVEVTVDDFGISQVTLRVNTEPVVSYD